jgi:hypothetical protein
LSAVTSVRFAALCFASRAPVTSGICFAADAAGFRLRLGGGFALAARRPKPFEKLFYNH